ncbi:fimbria/pilus outer membrane usher protein [Dyella sp.]|uniref:fimbria/pilus outer membrane usher protein n=1 Tax=Dyella sp. TaxID=1869338 RepID=UPI002ED3CDC1
MSFDTSLYMTGIGQSVDISRFEKSGYVLPGTYRGDVFVNGVWRAHRDITFGGAEGNGNSQWCFDASMLAEYGLDLGKLAAKDQTTTLKSLPVSGAVCGPIGNYVPGASATFDSSEQTLSIQVPQLYISRDARDYVDASQWNQGINATIINYNSNVYRNGGRNGSTNAFIGLNGSANLGTWHLYHLGAMSWRSGQGTSYQNTATYLQHDLPSLQAQVVAGDTFTSGDLFDSIRVRGVRMYTDDRMWPQSQRGYAPVVNGMAETNAHVSIRQNGYVIYDTNVAPGPFVIDDLYPTGYGGDLEVEVIEADGRVRRFTQPYSAVPQSLRAGQTLWTATAGRVSQEGVINAPSVLQSTWQHGLSNLLTLYTGGTIAQGYQSAIIGSAWNLSFGAVSTDLTYARTQLPGSKPFQGHSFRVGYNRNLNSSGTNLSVAAYRYSTPGFVGLSDAITLRSLAALNQSGQLQRQRSRVTMVVNQRLGDRYGQLYVSGSRADFWNSRGNQVDFTVGYSNTWGGVNFNLSVQRSRDSVDTVFAQQDRDRIPGASPIFTTQLPTVRDTRVLLTANLPLGRDSSGPMLSSTLTRSRNGGNSSRVGINGQFGTDRRFNYDASVAHAGGRSASLNGRYQGTRGNMSAFYSTGNGIQQFGGGADGSIVVHRDGMVFAQPSGDTIGLVHAPGATGARVDNQINSTVDVNGFAIVPNLMPYQVNTVALDPKGAGANVEFKSTSQRIAPRAGTVVRLEYKVDSSMVWLIDTERSDGKPVPFGAEVTDATGKSVGVAGQASRLIVRGVDAPAILTVRWAADEQGTCQVQLGQQAAPDTSRKGIQMVKAPCMSTSSTTPTPADKATALRRDHPATREESTTS